MMDNRLGILNKERIKEKLEILLNKMMSTIKKKRFNYIAFDPTYNLDKMNTMENSIYIDFCSEITLRNGNVLDTHHTRF